MLASICRRASRPRKGDRARPRRSPSGPRRQHHRGRRRAGPPRRVAAPRGERVDDIDGCSGGQLVDHLRDDGLDRRAESIRELRAQGSSQRPSQRRVLRRLAERQPRPHELPDAAPHVVLALGVEQPVLARPGVGLVQPVDPAAGGRRREDGPDVVVTGGHPRADRCEVQPRFPRAGRRTSRTDPCADGSRRSGTRSGRHPGEVGGRVGVDGLHQPEATGHRRHAAGDAVGDVRRDQEAVWVGEHER